MRERTEPESTAAIAREIASDCIGARIRMLSRTISRIYDERIRPFGIKFSQMNILTVVTLHGPVQPVEVGRLLSLEKSTLSRNVARMEASGWIQSLPAERNTRLLQVTRRGRRLLERAAPGWRQAQEEVASILGDRTSVELRQTADRMWRKSPTG